jgi:hypothetical protein
MNEQQIKNRIMFNIKALVSKDEEKSAKAFLYLVRTFFESANDILDDEDRYWCDNYAIILSIFLKLHQELFKEDDFENLIIINKVKTKLESEFKELIETDEEQYEFDLTNQYYEITLNKILMN